MDVEEQSYPIEDVKKETEAPKEEDSTRKRCLLIA